MTIPDKYMPIISVALSLSFCTPLSAKQLPPRDECLAIEGYYDLRQNLESIVKRRDSKALMALADPKIDTDFFGGEGSIASFKRNFNLEAGEKSYIWDEMEQIMRLGCDSRDGRIAFPYMDSHSNDVVEIDGYSKGARDGSTGHGVVIGNAVIMRDRPDENGAIVATLYWDIYDFEAYTERRDWAQISIEGGKTGWVKSSVLRDFSNTRMGFERKNGQWRMIYIVAGN